MQMPEGTVYLGDAVYASYDGYLIRLMVSNGETITDKIYLEPDVIAALFKFLESKGIEVK